MASGANKNYTDFYLGTGASQEISVGGFDPRYVRIVKLTDGTSTEYWRGMESAGAASAGGFTRDVAGAATPLTAAEGVSQVADVQGFLVGTSAAVNELDVLYAYIAND